MVIGDIEDPHKQEFLRAHDEEVRGLPRCTVRAHTESGPGTHAQLSHRPQVSALALSRSGLLIASGQLGSSRSPERVAPVVVWDYERRRQVFNLFGISQVRHHTMPQQHTMAERMHQPNTMLHRL